MCLLITLIAAIISTLVWYTQAEKDIYQIKYLCFMFGGASVMWFIDAVFEYAELGAEYFAPSAQEMVNDAFLGISVVVLGLLAWLVILLVKDPKGAFKKLLMKK